MSSYLTQSLSGKLKAVEALVLVSVDSLRLHDVAEDQIIAEVLEMTFGPLREAVVEAEQIESGRNSQGVQS